MLLTCVVSSVWATGWIEVHPHYFCWYPIVLCLACIPFLRCRHVLAFWGLLFAGGLATATAAGKDSGEEWTVFATLMALGALSRGIGLWLEQREATSPMSQPAILLGGLVILLPAFFLSFHMGPEKSVVKNMWIAEGWWWTLLLGLVYVGTAATWVMVLRGAAAEDRSKKHLAMLAAALLVTLGLAAGHDIVLPVMANLALLLVSGALLWDAVTAAQRREFWLGLGMFVVIVFARFLKWDTQLMLKSAVFILCGIGVTIGGVRFERHLKGREAS